MATLQGFGSLSAYEADKVSRSAAGAIALVEADRLGTVLSTSGTAVDATVPTGLPLGWSTTLVQNGAGKVTVVGPGVTFRNASAGLRTTARGARVYLEVIGTNEVLVSSPHLESAA